MMNKNIEKLHAISKKTERHIIGLMSGTSLDGLDVAHCLIEGSGAETKLTLRQFITVPYNADFKTEVKNVFSKEQVNLQKLCLLNEWIAKQHAQMVNDCLKNWNIAATEIDLIASHGQTIYHAPLTLHGLQEFGNGTLQIGDGDHLAVNTGIITISDFRQKHIAAGGEGAPLAAYGDYLLFKKTGEDVILLNIGGIANFTFLPADEKDGRMCSSDTGPGNGLMDAWMQQNFPGQYYDKDAGVAKQGQVNDGLLKCLLQHDFFHQPLPKTTGPELFNLQYLHSAIEKSGNTKISIADTMATLNRFTAQSIIDAIGLLHGDKKCTIYVSGGGMHNPILMDYLKENLKEATIESTKKKNIDPDAKEAILFAILANECVAGDVSVFGTATKNFPAISMGKISFPF
jgi:anhydro-N-acetylmuramic acid kinase